MALQLTRIFVEDESEVAVQNAVVTLHRTSTGEPFYALTDVNGMASFTVEEDLYAMSVTKSGYVSPAAVKIAVSPPPAAVPAVFNPPALAAPGLISATDKNIEVTVDPLLGGLPVLIDVSGGDNVALDEAEIVANINAALFLVNPLWLNVASNYLGEIRLTSPTAGANSGIVVRNDGMLVADATQEVFGLDGVSGNVSVTGDDAPLDYNDFDATLSAYGVFVASNPAHCMLWGRFWKHALTDPLVGATVWFEIMERPSAVDVGIDVGDSTYATTDSHGYLKFELMRGTKVRMYLQWLDKHIDFTVPRQSSCNLDRLLSPFVEEITATLSTIPATLAVGSSDGVSIKALCSDGSVRNLVSAVTLVSSNQAVLSLSGLVATGVSVGVANITATYVNEKGQTITSEPLIVEVTA